MPIMMSMADDDADDEATPVVCFQKTHAARSTERPLVCLLYRGLLLCDKFHRNPQTVFPLNRATVASHAYYFSACMYVCVSVCVLIIVSDYIREMRTVFRPHGRTNDWKRCRVHSISEYRPCGEVVRDIVSGVFHVI